MTTEQQAGAQPVVGDDLIPVTLVPVEVFGGDCTCHEAQARGEQGDCAGWGYGLMDAVQSWSDCNRAVGRIYRAEDLAEPGEDPARYRKPGEVLTIQVPRGQAAWFERKWGDEAGGRDSVAYIRGEVVLAELVTEEDLEAAGAANRVCSRHVQAFDGCGCHECGHSEGEHPQWPEPSASVETAPRSRLEGRQR